MLTTPCRVLLSAAVQTQLPRCDTVCQNALHAGSEEVHKQLLLQVVESLLSLLHHCFGVSRPEEDQDC